MKNVTRNAVLSLSALAFIGGGSLVPMVANATGLEKPTKVKIEKVVKQKTIKAPKVKSERAARPVSARFEKARSLALAPAKPLVAGKKESLQQQTAEKPAPVKPVDAPDYIIRDGAIRDASGATVADVNRDTGVFYDSQNAGAVITPNDPRYATFKEMLAEHYTDGFSQ